MTLVDLSILGRAFPVQCEPGEEARVEALAGYVDGRLRQLAAAQTSATETRLLLLGCLLLADEIFELKGRGEQRADTRAPARKPDTNETDQALLVAAVAHLQERLEGLVQRLESVEG